MEIGGIHLRGPPAPVPSDLAAVLDKDNEFGVIVFTFGSLVAMNSLPENVLDALKFAFGRLPQTIIWKYENDYMPNKPQNVILCKWLPQRSILKHPNVKLFMSHGGMSGVYEAIDAGVPILGIPLFYDQPRNIQNLVNLGIALSLKIDNMTKTTLFETISHLLDNQSFSENAKHVSFMFRDRPLTPADSAVYWIEYLIRYGKDANTRPVSADASWINHFMIDMFVALLTTVFVLWFCARFILYKTLQIVFSSR